MSADLLAALSFLAAAGLIAAVVGLRRASRKVDRILDRRRWEASTGKAFDVLDWVAIEYAEAIVRAAYQAYQAERRRP